MSTTNSNSNPNPNPNPSAPTILDLKTSFLRSQINALSQPLAASPNWTSRIPPEAEAEAEEDRSRKTPNQPSQRAVDDAVHKLNAQLRRHARLSYAPQAARHVAEQIDRLYWKAGERGVLVVSGGGEEWSERGVDFRHDRIIAQLPPHWSEEADQRAPDQAQRYAHLQLRLTELSAQRERARARVGQYKAMRELLAPLEAGVQENIVTRNGEVEQELERMRMLMVRVERGVGALDGRERDDEGEEMDVDVDLDRDEGKKVEAFLGSL